MKPNSPQLRRTYLSQLAEEKATEEGGSDAPKKVRKKSPFKPAKRVKPAHGEVSAPRTFAEHNQFTHFPKDL